MRIFSRAGWNRDGYLQDLKGKIDQQAVEAIDAFVTPRVGSGRFAVTLTGEHTGALRAIRVHPERYLDLCVFQIDTHGDLRHASVMARVVDDGLPLVQVGIRSIGPEEIERINSCDLYLNILRRAAG